MNQILQQNLSFAFNIILVADSNLYPNAELQSMLKCNLPCIGGKPLRNKRHHLRISLLLQRLRDSFLCRPTRMHQFRSWPPVSICKMKQFNIISRQEIRNEKKEIRIGWFARNNNSVESVIETLQVKCKISTVRIFFPSIRSPWTEHRDTHLSLFGW